MAGGQVIITPFDGNKKSGWLFADFNGFFYTYIVTVVLGIVLGMLIHQFLGIDISVPMTWISQVAEGQWGRGAGFWTVLGLSTLPSWLLVFVFRLNFTVTGGQRKFRYLCRWL